MTCVGQRAADCLAALEVITAEGTLRYALRAQSRGLLCVRSEAFADGSCVRLLLPFGNTASLAVLLAADGALRARRAQTAGLLAAARRRLAAAAETPASIGAADLQAAAAQLEGAPDVGALHESMRAVAATLGFDDYAAVLGRYGETEDTDLHWLAGADPAWCLIFMTRHWYLNSALLARARSTDRPAFGSEVPAATDGQRAMRAATLRHGYRCAVAFPRRLPPDASAGNFGAVLLLGRADPPAGEAGARRHATVARGLFATFIDRWAELIAAEQAATVRLSAIEVRLLQFVAAGRSATQVAAALGKNTTAVHNHYRRLYAKLGVRSKHAALARARALRLLGEQEPDE